MTPDELVTNPFYVKFCELINRLEFGEWSRLITEFYDSLGNKNLKGRRLSILNLHGDEITQAKQIIQYIKSI